MPNAPHVLLTGASRGIGRATALLLAERGARLSLVGRPSQALDETLHAVSELAAKGAAARPGRGSSAFACDLARPLEIEAAAAQILEASGPPDAVIHNAAVIERLSLAELALESWQRQLDVNLQAPYVLTRALLPALRGRGKGRFVFVGSISSTLGTPGASAYCASKWGLVGFMRSLAAELSDSGVTCVAVLPGSVDTEMLEGSGFAPRMSAEDVARTLVHYALDAPAAHNGGIVEMFGV